MLSFFYLWNMSDLISFISLISCLFFFFSLLQVSDLCDLHQESEERKRNVNAAFVFQRLSFHFPNLMAVMNTRRRWEHHSQCQLSWTHFSLYAHWTGCDVFQICSYTKRSTSSHTIIYCWHLFSVAVEAEQDFVSLSEWDEEALWGVFVCWPMWQMIVKCLCLPLGP